MYEQNSICSQIQLKDIVQEHTIICKQLFLGHVVGFRPMKRKKNLHQMIIIIISVKCCCGDPAKIGDPM